MSNTDIPRFDEFMKPVLKFCGDGKEHIAKEIKNTVMSLYDFSDEQLSRMTPKGNAFVIEDRLHWAIYYLRIAGLLTSVSRGIHVITKEGLNLLESNEFEKLNLKYLQQHYPNVVEKHSSNKSKKNKAENKTPVENIEDIVNNLNENLGKEILENIFSNNPYFFEKVVVELLEAMGYGEGFVTKKSHDNGVDGIIKQDVLGLDTIYVQAKRYKNKVGINDVKNFAASMEGETNKGVFITTSDFDKTVINYLNKINKSIILIDGQKLVELMIKYNLGTRIVRTYEIKEIDSDYFNPEM